MNSSTKKKFVPHLHLQQLITNKFNVHLEIQHLKDLRSFTSPCGTPVKAVTRVQAFKSKELSKTNPFGYIGEGKAYCNHEDQFVRAEGLTIALRRLYRQLSDLKINQNARNSRTVS